ncbi:MAG: hypothetical protein JOY82_28315 [Streptosporangiaceae bacterium]|nr:hypothetical protein [Streptosporangiaceae bacterium]MBV9858390.1 hypothetical protein [Streptosporangiaceae bacterium]
MVNRDATLWNATGRDATGRDATVWDATEAEPFVVAAVAAILPFALLVQVLINLHDFRQPAVPVAVWAGMLAVSAWLVPRQARRGRLTAAEAAVAIGTAFAAVTAVDWDRRVHAGPGEMGWPVLGAVWLLALVALSRPARTWVSGALLVFAAHAAFVVHVLGLSPPGLTLVTAAAYLIVVMVGVFANLRPMLRTRASMAARRASLASEAAAERAAVSAMREDRRQQLALLEAGALPLLRGIADGTLDPADVHVRERCSRHAAALRHSLTHGARDAAGLPAGLGPALRTAAARGVLVEVQVIGDPVSPPPDVARAVFAAVDGVLGALPPSAVTLTVMRAGAGAELYMTFSVPGGAALRVPGVAQPGREAPGPARWHATLDIDETGTGCLAVSWRTAGAPGAGAPGAGAPETGGPEGGCR